MFCKNNIDGEFSIGDAESLAFDDNNYVFDGKVYDIDKLDLESKKLPWEKEAYE